jgi:hypothetical protein
MQMSMLTANPLEAFHWEPQPAAQTWVKEALKHVTGVLPDAAALGKRLSAEAGVRLIDLIDTIIIGDDAARLDAALLAGWRQQENEREFEIYTNRLGVFPQIAVSRKLPSGRVAIDLKVESVADFLAANNLNRPITGEPGLPWRVAGLWEAKSVAAIGVVERHGWAGSFTDQAYDLSKAISVAENFRTRQRLFDDDAEGFIHTGLLIDQAIDAVGQDLACQLFFAAEREYWQLRNRAAQVQKARQDRLGIGWANHDHHTYRSSREHFAGLVGLWEKLGMHCRERFYAGREAGWGAQVMEQPTVGIITFNDVDLSPGELMGDFSHDGLAPQDKLGTVGLWCSLHGEAVLQAGMHHLEGMFDFNSLRDQLAAAEVNTMKPFTNFPYLRQAFTEGERWPVAEKRIATALAAGYITQEQAKQFREQGAIGSHLENLERNDGFKGFNQTGVSQIIAATDPRKQLKTV